MADSLALAMATLSSTCLWYCLNESISAWVVIASVLSPFCIRYRAASSRKSNFLALASISSWILCNIQIPAALDTSSMKMSKQRCVLSTLLIQCTRMDMSPLIRCILLWAVITLPLTHTMRKFCGNSIWLNSKVQRLVFSNRWLLYCWFCIKFVVPWTRNFFPCSLVLAGLRKCLKREIKFSCRLSSKLNYM